MRSQAPTRQERGGGELDSAECPEGTALEELDSAERDPLPPPEQELDQARANTIGNHNENLALQDLVNRTVDNLADSSQDQSAIARAARSVIGDSAVDVARNFLQLLVS